MKLTKLLTILTIFIVFSSCGGPSMSSVWQRPNYTSLKYNTIAVVALMNNMTARQQIEQNITSMISKRNPGTKFVTGLQIFPPNISKDQVTEDYINNFLKTNGVDAVITSALVNTYISQQWVAGDAADMPFYYGPGAYMYGAWGFMNTPDYYVPTQNFVMQTSIFDLKLGNDQKSSLVWKGESEVSGPSSIADGAYDYCSNVVQYLYKSGFLVATNN